MKLVSFFFAVFIAGFWSHPNAEASSPRHLKVGMISDITSLDPHNAFVDTNLMVSRLIFGRLFDFGPNKEVIPQLAESAERQAGDQTLWAFRLRKGVKFHRGQEFDKHDVLCSMERVLRHGKQPSGYASQLQVVDMDRTRQLNGASSDPLLLQIATKSPYRFMPQNMASLFVMSCADTSRALAENALDSEAEAQQRISARVDHLFAQGELLNGTQPFSVESWAPLASGGAGPAPMLRLQRLPGFDANWDTIDVVPVPDAGARAQKLMEGELDLIANVAASDLARLGRFKVVTRPSLRVIHIQMAQNTSDRESDARHVPLRDESGKAYPSPFSSWKVRDAFYRAIQKQELLAIMQGQASLTGQYMPLGTVGHMPNIPADLFFPSKPFAEPRRLLHLAAQEAGMEFLRTKGLVLTLHGPNDRYPNDGKILHALAKMWTAAFGSFQVDGQEYSLRVVAKDEPKASYFANSGKYLFGLLGGGVDNGHVEGALRLYFMPGSGLNFAGYTHPEVKALYQQGLADSDFLRGDQTLTRALAVALEDRAILPLYNQVGAWAMRPDLGFEPKVDEVLDMEKVVVGAGN